jgi:hypothetical protein
MLPLTSNLAVISEARGGRDSIDHASGAHDDIANSVAGALVTAYKEPGVKNFNRKLNYQPPGIV